MLQQMIMPLFFLFTAVGAWLLISDLCPAPSRAARTAVLSYRKKGKTTLFSTWSNQVAARIRPLIRIGKYKRVKLEQLLVSAHIPDTPEEYMAKAIAPALLYGLCTIPVTALIHPLLALAFGYMAVSQYIGRYRKAEKLMKQKKDAITLELPHFAATIAEELKKGRNVIPLLTSYSKVCGEQFRSEINITIADMQTGNHREAIGRLSSRVGSLGLTQICRGLQSAMDGNDQQLYFQVLTQSLELEQEQHIERYIQTLFHKIKPYSFLLFGCMIMILLTAIGIYLFSIMTQ